MELKRAISINIFTDKEGIEIKVSLYADEIKYHVLHIRECTPTKQKANCIRIPFVTLRFFSPHGDSFFTTLKFSYHASLRKCDKLGIYFLFC